MFMLQLKTRIGNKRDLFSKNEQFRENVDVQMYLQKDWTGFQFQSYALH